MRIPIRNLFALLCYAWDALDLLEEDPVGTELGPRPEDLLGRLLAEGCERLLRRGLVREYVPHDDETALPRGRIDFQETIRRQSQRRHRLCVTWDELSVDVPANQVLRASVRLLLRVPTLDARLRDTLAGVHRALDGISGIELTTAQIRRVRVHRNHRDYRLLMAVCEMIVESVAPAEDGRSLRFKDPRRDKARMRTLFEAFVFNFLRREQDDFEVTRPAFDWRDLECLRPGPATLPRMRTDVVLRDAARVLVIETKFTPRPFDGYYGSTTLRSAHVYQLFAYLNNLPTPFAGDRSIEGLLLYPVASTPAFDLAWRMGPRVVRAASVDLAAEWSAIRDRLLGLRFAHASTS